MRTRQRRIWLLVVLVSLALLPVLVSAHGPVGQEAALAPLDPELFSGWQA